MLLPLETPTLPFMVRSAPPFEVSRSAPQGVRGSGDNFAKKIFKCRWFLGRHDICQKIYTTGFSGQTFYTVEVRDL